MVRVAVEHAGLGQGLHKGVDEAPRDGGSPTIMPRREGITLSGRLLFMNGVAVSWPALVFEVDAEFRPMKLHNDRDSGQKVSLTGPESHTKWYLMIECEAILGKKPVTLTTDIQTTLYRGMFEKNPALSKLDTSDAKALGSSCFVSAALSVPDMSKFS